VRQKIEEILRLDLQYQRFGAGGCSRGMESAAEQIEKTERLQRAERLGAPAVIPHFDLSSNDAEELLRRIALAEELLTRGDIAFPRDRRDAQDFFRGAGGEVIDTLKDD